MPRSTVEVTPSVLRWARESSGYDLEEAAKRIGANPEKLAAAEAGVVQLTLRQAENAADTYDRPLAVLFMDSPPPEEPQSAQFRQLPDAPAPPWPPGMVRMARRIQSRQMAAIELYELVEEEPRWPTISALLSTESASSLSDAARRILGVTLDQQFSWRDGYKALRRWTDAVEGLGILVAQSGEVSLELMRGFASLDAVVPAVVINAQDDPRARAYTLIHEMGHLTLGARRESVADPEGWCDEFAGNVIMPPSPLTERYLRTSGTTLERVDALAGIFSVTPAAATVRSIRVGLLTQAEGNQVLEEIRRRHHPRGDGGGGNYYTTQIGRVGPSFIRLVFSALENQALTYPMAAGLLDVKVNNFQKLRTFLDRREGATA